MPSMELDNILNTKGNPAAAAAAAEAQFRQQQFAQMNPNTSADMNSDRSSANTPLDNPMYHGNPPQSTPQGMQPSNQMAYSGTPQPYMPMDGFQGAPRGHEIADGQNGNLTGNSTRSNSDPAPKLFACSTCQKQFARRSDLARHERIHSGVRPHVCDYPGCGKQFIQRSALTVHARVHTGEKPHMCERCGKPFSDSSSLARHRRIHSGQRPYKCPYANCQKTFTRRTTLTRHQNHHSGTIEEAAAETNAKLSNGKDKASRTSDGPYSENGSVQSTPSPSQRPSSMSPGQDLPPIPNMHRQGSDFGYIPNGGLPLHLRNDMQQPSPRSIPGSPPPSNNNFSSNHRPSMTSHPNNYGPPQPLEPPANNDHRSQGSGSPHMSAIGWGSPQPNSMPSPQPVDNYAYPDPTYGGQPLYYPGSNMRRPQSTEPDDYSLKTRSMQVGTEWNPMPVMH